MTWNIIACESGRVTDRSFDFKLNVNDKFVTSDREVASEFEKFFTDIPLSTTQSLNSSPDIIIAFRSLDVKKTADLWGLSVKVVSSIIDVVAPHLATIFNGCIEHGVFPDLMKHSKVSAQYEPVYIENADPEGNGAQSRIVSGWEAQPGQHPHQVSLRMVNRLGTVTGCGGNVIHREWLLTAAHCTASQVSLIVRAGLVHMTRPEMMLETNEYYVYPTFDASRPLEVQLDDISLVKLQQPLIYSENLRSIRVQPSSDAFRNYDTQVVRASGFGRTWTGGSQSAHLMWVYLRSISNQACANIFTTRYVSATTICARFYNVTSQSICQGDSGGPLVHVSSDNEPILIGISSFVAGNPQGCHSGLPGAFIRPGPFHEWFTQITGIDFNNLKEDIEPTTVAPTTPSPSPTTPSPTTPSPTTPPPTTAPPTVPSTLPPTTTSPPTSTTTTSPPTSTTTPPTTTPDPDEDDIDDPELSELLKRLEVIVKVKVRLSKYKNNKEENMVLVE
ncbi:serine protease 3-like [Melitaea cinxia]|uniref:serine protease 3-like n=1 Tax=Melitaea cinxia TaxID=113334 RepID=UPI001E26EF7D|nr:serine protease 3-like [Melitaea cinxia]